MGRRPRATALTRRRPHRLQATGSRLSSGARRPPSRASPWRRYGPGTAGPWATCAAVPLVAVSDAPAAFMLTGGPLLFCADHASHQGPQDLARLLPRPPGYGRRGWVNARAGNRGRCDAAAHLTARCRPSLVGMTLCRERHFGPDKGDFSLYFLAHLPEGVTPPADLDSEEVRVGPSRPAVRPVAGGGQDAGPLNCALCCTRRASLSRHSTFPCWS